MLDDNAVAGTGSTFGFGFPLVTVFVTSFLVTGLPSPVIFCVRLMLILMVFVEDFSVPALDDDDAADVAFLIAAETAAPMSGTGAELPGKEH